MLQLDVRFQARAVVYLLRQHKWNELLKFVTMGDATQAMQISCTSLVLFVLFVLF